MHHQKEELKEGRIQCVVIFSVSCIKKNIFKHISIVFRMCIWYAESLLIIPFLSLSWFNTKMQVLIYGYTRVNSHFFPLAGEKLPFYMLEASLEHIWPFLSQENYANSAPSSFWISQWWVEDHIWWCIEISRSVSWSNHWAYLQCLRLEKYISQPSSQITFIRFIIDRYLMETAWAHGEDTYL